MASLQNVDPVVRNYIIKNSLPEVYKALLTALCTSCPESPLQFLEEKIMELKTHGNLVFQRYSGVDPVQMNVASLTGKFWQDFRSPGDRVSLSHLFEKTYSCYRKNVTTMCFKAWRQYIFRRKEQATELTLKMNIAERQHMRKMTQSSLHKWVEWVQIRKKRQKEAISKIHRVWNCIYCKMVIGAWQYVVQDSRKTKEYFERLEKGLLDMGGCSSAAPLVEGKDEVSQLPWKLAVKIFQSLDVGDLIKCARVCRTWKAIIQTCSLWGRINFSSEKHRIVDRVVGQILQKYRPYVLHLNMRGCSALQWSSFQCVSECKNLQELNLSECTNINDETMRLILESCSTVLYLNLSYTAITNGTFRVLSRCCLNLQHLSLAYCRRFTDKGLQYLATGKGCHKIIHLDLSGCTQISVEGFGHVATACGLLRHVELNDVPTLSDSCVVALVSKCRSLNTVSLLDTPHLSDVAFRAIGEVCRLTRIRIEGNNRMTDASWRAFCRNSPNLRHIGAADCPRLTDISIKSMGSLKNLTSLNVADCMRVTDLGLRCLVEGPSGAKIRQLNVSNCGRLSDVSLMRLAQKCPSLNYLTLCYCDHLTDTGVEWLGGSSSLISLDLSGTNLQDQGLAALGSSSGLKRLSVSECFWITDIGIEKFCKQSRGLEHMDMSHCLFLSDLAVKALSFYCRTIVTLRMSGCPKVTDKSMQYLSGAGHFLRELDVSACVRLTDKATKFLHRGCLKLRSIKMLYCQGISKQAALLLQPRIQYWEHSREDVPSWYGYDNLGQLLLQPIKKQSKVEEPWAEEKDETGKQRRDVFP